MAGRAGARFAKSKGALPHSFRRSLAAFRTSAQRARRRSNSSTLSRSSSDKESMGRSVRDLMRSRVEATRMNCAVSPSGSSGSFSTYARYASVTSESDTSDMESLRSSMRLRSASSGPEYVSVCKENLFMVAREARHKRQELRKNTETFSSLLDLASYLLSLRRQAYVDAVHVAGECGRLFHIGKFEHAGGEALEPRRGAAVRRQAELESLKIEREFFRIEAALLHARDEGVVIVDALRTAVDFESAKKEVEAARVRRFRRVLIGIECAFLGRISRDENKVGILFFLGPLTDSALVFRLHIGRFLFSERFKCLFEREYRYLVGYERRLRIEAREHIGVLARNGVHGVAYGLLQNFHRLALIINETHFKIDARRFRKVAGRGALFSTEYFADRKGALEWPDHYLFVELRGRGEVGGLVVVVSDLERGGAAFRIAAHQHRRFEFGEVLRTQ